MPIPFVLFFIFLVIILLGGFFSHRKQSERTAALQQLAQSQGWEFLPQKNRTHHREFSQFSIFKRGDARYAYNTLRGALAISGVTWPVQMGDYHYQTSSTNNKSKSTTTHRFSYLIVTMPYLSVPSLTIRQEHLFDRLAGFLGFDDIDFESAEFSNKFHVKSSDKRFAYDVIHPRMMGFLLDGDPPTLDLQQGCGCVSDDKQCWSPEKLLATLNWVEKFFSHWPPHVITQLDTGSK